MVSYENGQLFLLQKFRAAIHRHERKPDAIAVSIQTIKNIDAQILAKPFTPNADHQSAQWTMAKNLMEAQTAVLESFKQTMESLPK